MCHDRRIPEERVVRLLCILLWLLLVCFLKLITFFRQMCKKLIYKLLKKRLKTLFLCAVMLLWLLL